MEFDIVTLGVVIGMMVLANRLVASLVTPLFDKYSWDKFWLMYPAWVISGVFVWFTGLNLFSTFIPNELIGKILTAVVAGGGSNLLHDLTDKPDNMVAYFDGIESAVLHGDGSGEPLGILRHEDIYEDEAEGMQALLRSRKFWLMILDVVISTITYFVTAYVVPEIAEQIIWVIGAWQPVIVALIIGIAVEDAAVKGAATYFVEDVAREDGAVG